MKEIRQRIEKEHAFTYFSSKIARSTEQWRSSAAETGPQTQANRAEAVMTRYRMKPGPINEQNSGKGGVAYLGNEVKSSVPH